MIYGSVIYEEAYALSVGWYKHELGQIVAVTEARQRYLEGTYEHPNHYYIHNNIPPRRLHPIPAHENVSWDTDVNDLPPLSPVVHPWSEAIEIGEEGPTAERLDDDWAPVILEGLHSVEIEDTASSDHDAAPPLRKKQLDATMKHVLRTFYLFTEDDLRKVNNLLGMPKHHSKLVPALITGGVEEGRAASLASWMLGDSSEDIQNTGPSRLPNPSALTNPNQKTSLREMDGLPRGII